MSPVAEDLSGLPPSSIHVGEHELLRIDAETMATRLSQAGRTCELHVREGQMHDFPAAAPRTHASNAALDQMARFIVDATSRPPKADNGETA
ncbi:alpha/beta hydrolase [Tomitella gaofuii]|uniref:alpha/beta hydrolase n=1 Tax=Tomitella gaofuii TaxID=2760083 RepID=UPI002E2B5D21|nr:alpha/beta hydrolase [Tomitella gaofuii]